MKKIAFNNVNYTEASLESLSGPSLVELYNDLAEALSNGDTIPTVRRFADKSTAVSRTWKMLQRHHESAQKAEDVPEAKAIKTEPAPVVPQVVEKKAPAVEKKDAPKAEKKARTSRGTNLIPQGFAPIACREGSKQAQLLDLLSRPEGATMAQLIEGLSGGSKPWVEATVRSGFGWDMKNKGYGVRSNWDKDGVERFHIVLPMKADGTTYPIPAHTPLKGKKSEA